MGTYETVVEGRTDLKVPVKGSFGKRTDGTDRKAPVFYNRRMELQRSVCCAVVKAIARREEVLFADTLAGLGAKGLRIAKETGCEVHLNDGSPEACAAIKENAKLNRLKVNVSNRDARLFLAEHASEFNFIDVDPFGTPTPFLDAAASALKKGGYLGVTATDTAPLCGVYREACCRKYGAVPLRSPFCHEVGIRILLAAIAKACARHSMGMTCLLAHSTEHYFRVYVRTAPGKKMANRALSNLGFVYYCRGCMDMKYEKGPIPKEKKCGCGGKYELSGPLWLGEIKDEKFLKEVLTESTDACASKLISMIIEELDEPLYYNTHAIADHYNLEVVRIDELIEGLRKEGYRASKTHFSPVAVKSGAGIKEVVSLFSK